jgi:hypothetical protein
MFFEMLRLLEIKLRRVLHSSRRFDDVEIRDICGNGLDQQVSATVRLVPDIDLQAFDPLRELLLPGGRAGDPQDRYPVMLKRPRVTLPFHQDHHSGLAYLPETGQAIEGGVVTSTPEELGASM